MTNASSSGLAYKPVPGKAPSPALSPEQLAAFQLAHKRAKKVRRATSVALTDAYLTAIFAALTAVAGVFDITNLVLGLYLAFVAFNSFRGANRFKKFDTSAPRLLALNQLGLACVIILYCAWSLLNFQRSTAEYMKELSNPQLADALGGIDFKGMAWYFALAVYGGLAAATIVVQGCTAIYYLTRKRELVAYLQSTPEWIVDLQKAQAGL